jgi:hypothetical protein
MPGPLARAGSKALPGTAADERTTGARHLESESPADLAQTNPASNSGQGNSARCTE